MAELVDALVSGTSGSNALEVRVFLSAPSFGVVAQLIERYVRIVEVVGLSPISSTIKIQTPFIGVLIFFGAGRETTDVGLYRRKKADGSIPVYVFGRLYLYFCIRYCIIPSAMAGCHCGE